MSALRAPGTALWSPLLASVSHRHRLSTDMIRLVGTKPTTLPSGVCSAQQNCRAVLNRPNAFCFLSETPKRVLFWPNVDRCVRERLMAGSALGRCLTTSAVSGLRRTRSVSEKEQTDDDKPDKPSLLQRFKRMYKEYWYILLPVHLATSTVWLGTFYYASKSGVDVAGMLEWIGFGENITGKLRNSAAGHVAIAYALYKLATPARYTVTLGGTTYSIKWLSERGYIKPVPSRAEMREIYQDRRDEMRDKMQEIGERQWKDHEMRKRRWRERFQERRKRGWSRRK